MSVQVHKPVFKTAPYAHQLEAYELSIFKEYFAYLMDPGTGKTKVILDRAYNLFLMGLIDQLFVVAPNGVHAQWINEQVPAHLPEGTYVTYLWQGIVTKKQEQELDSYVRDKTKRLHIFAVNFDIFSYSTYVSLFRYVCETRKTFLVVDEASRIKNPEAKRTEAIVYELNGVEAVLSSTATYTAKFRAILSGTIVTRSPFDLFAPWNFLCFNFFGMAYFAFKMRYGLSVTDIKTTKDKNTKFGRNMKPNEMLSIRRYYEKGFDVEAISGIMRTSESNVRWILENPDNTLPYKRLDELMEKIKPHSYFKHLEDCVDIKEPIRQKRLLTMTKEHRRIYNQVKNDLYAEYAGKELTVNAVIAVTTRLSQISAGIFPYEDENGKDVKWITTDKIEAVAEDLSEFSFDTPLLLFSCFVPQIKKTTEIMRARFPDLRVEEILGEVDVKKREEIRTDFSAGDVNILVLYTGIGGIGYNLQRSRHTGFLANRYGFYEERGQAEGRTYRLGQQLEKPVLFRDYVYEKSIDIAALEDLDRKRKLSGYFQGRVDYSALTISDILEGGL